MHRYASWIHQLRVGEGVSAIRDDTFRSLRANSPVGGWFPALQNLSWRITEESHPYTDLFFSPGLKNISIWVSWDSRGPSGVLSTIASAISALPTSALRILHVDGSYYEVRWVDFKASFSSIALRCGPSLAEFVTRAPLSDAAINHLIQLPYLHIWRVEDPPPRYSTSSLPLLFPPLVGFTLGKGAAGWFSLFKRLEGRVCPTQGMTPLSRMKGSLKYLSVNNNNLPGLAIDVSLTSLIQLFRNLVDLRVKVRCHDCYKEGGCSFKLNNDNVTEFAMALPRLEFLFLGRPCYENGCATTVACLLPISVHCVKLRELEIHFNTTNIIDDLKNLSEDPRFQELRSLPRCTLTCLHTYQMPLTLDEPDFETVANGMIDIFPSIRSCDGLVKIWEEISKRIAEIQITRSLLVGHWWG